VVDAGEHPPALTTELRSDLADFLDALRVEAGLAKSTLTGYRADLVRFLAWAVPHGVASFRDLGPDHLTGFLAHERERGMSEATLARGLSALRTCLRHLCAAGRLDADPSTRIDGPTLRRALPTTLAVTEVEELLRAPGSEGWRAERDTAFLEVLYACGARVGEAIGLTTDGIQPSLRVLVLTGKGGKTRVVPVGARARAALERWIEGGRRQLAAPLEKRVFVSRSGKPLDRTAAWRLVKRAARAAGLSAAISPHTLRHSFASHLIEGGADLRSVQEMLGHASIHTTEIYTHLDVEHVRSLHRLYHPRG
jgi:integrase/recombinase XerD